MRAIGCFTQIIVQNYETACNKARGLAGCLERVSVDCLALVIHQEYASTSDVSLLVTVWPGPAPDNVNRPGTWRVYGLVRVRPVGPAILRLILVIRDLDAISLHEHLMEILAWLDLILVHDLHYHWFSSVCLSASGPEAIIDPRFLYEGLFLYEGFLVQCTGSGILALDTSIPAAVYLGQYDGIQAAICPCSW